MTRYLFAFTCLALSLVSSPTLAEEVTLNQRIDKILNAHGGAEVWKKTQAIVHTGDTFSQSRHAMGSTQRSYQYPDKFRISIDYPGNDSELRQLNGDKVWDHGQLGSEPFAKATQLQAMRMMPAKQLLEHRDIAKDLGTRTDENGVAHHGIDLNVNGLRLIIDSDAETGFILATWGVMEMMGQNMQFATFYHDYRVIDGRAIAFKEEHYAMGSYTGHTEIKEVNFPESLPDTLFSPVLQ